MTAPAEQIEQDVLDIVGVVLGDKPVPLSRPARAAALAAMNALGYGCEYMGEQLGVTARSIGSLASKLEVPISRNRAFVDHRAVQFVLQGTPMKLRGNDMDAALLHLHERGKTVIECADLLRADRQTVRKHARDLGITLNEERVEDCWWNRYYETARDTSRHPWREH